jgi:hypothetical protein
MILKKMDKAKVSKLRMNMTDGSVIGAELPLEIHKDMKQ